METMQAKVTVHKNILPLFLLLQLVLPTQVYAGDELIATVEVNGAATAVYYDHTDHLGGSSVLTNATGSREQLLDYYPFGGIRLNEKVASFDEQRKFTGQEYDTSTNLHYYGQRYYNQDVGRFTSQDPVHLLIGDEQRFKDKAQRSLEFHLSDPQSLNSYSYVNNNPLKYTDPEGELIPLLLLAGYAIMALDIAGTAYDVYNIASTHLNPNATEAQRQEAVSLFAFGLTIPGSGKFADDLFKPGVKQIAQKHFWGNPYSLQRHFQDHGADFGATSPADYAQKASEFLKYSQSNKLPTKIDEGGIIRTYDSGTNTFGVYNPDGTTATLFKPDPKVHGYKTNEDYWNAQQGSEI